MDHANPARDERKRIQGLLASHGVQPTAQRVRVAELLFACDQHLTAEQVIQSLGKDGTHVSKATVYNTLNLFADKGLISRHVIAEGRVVFDSVVEPHHHFIDEATGRIHDVPWDAIRVEGVSELPGFDVRSHQVVMRGRRSARSKDR